MNSPSAHGTSHAGKPTPATSFAPGQPRPLNIVWAEILLYAATTIWLLRLIGEHLNGAPVESLMIPAIFLLVQLMLIPAAMHGRSRLLLACLILFCVGVLVLDLIQQAIQTRVYRWEPPRMRFSILRLAQMAFETVAFAFLFINRRGRQWFHRNSSAKPRNLA